MQFIGIDVGTTAIKVVLFSDDGEELSSWRGEYPTRRSAGGLVEQDPADWLSGVRRGLTAVLHGRPLDGVGAVGLCSQVNTHVFVDADGTALLPAIVWQDTRAAADAKWLDTRIPDEQRVRWWGAPLPIDASHALSRMRWLARTNPRMWEHTHCVLSPKDYCIRALTGTLVADPIASVGLVDLQLRYVQDLLELVPGARDRLPPLHALDAAVGTIDLGDGRAVPVAAGTMDAWASLFGAGACEPGRGLYMSGTSEILALVGDRRVGAPGVITFPTLDGRVVSAGPTQSGGDSVRWWARATGRDEADVLVDAARADRYAGEVLFVPHLQGERAPYWDATLRGSFTGLSTSVDSSQLSLAVLEGVALSARVLLQSLENAAGYRARSLVCGGGGSRSDLWMQIRADCLGIPLQRLANTDAGCLGAAAIAAAAVGRFPDVYAASSAMARIERTFEPDARAAARYDALAAAYARTVQALKSIEREPRPASPASVRTASVDGRG